MLFCHSVKFYFSANLTYKEGVPKSQTIYYAAVFLFLLQHFLLTDTILCLIYFYLIQEKMCRTKSYSAWSSPISTADQTTRHKTWCVLMLTQLQTMKYYILYILLYKFKFISNTFPTKCVA